MLQRIGNALDQHIGSDKAQWFLVYGIYCLKPLRVVALRRTIPYVDNPTIFLYDLNQLYCNIDYLY